MHVQHIQCVCLSAIQKKNKKKPVNSITEKCRIYRESKRSSLNLLGIHRSNVKKHHTYIARYARVKFRQTIVLC